MIIGSLGKADRNVQLHQFDEPARIAAEPNPISKAYWVNEVLAARAEAGDIHRADTLEVTQSTVSHHLRELEHAGVIQLERQGKGVYCIYVAVGQKNSTVRDVVKTLEARHG